MAQISATVIEVHLFKETNNGIEYLILQRSKDEIYPNLWQPITGSIELNETAYQAAIREVKEETNLDIEKLWIVPTINSYYSAKYDRITFIFVFVAKIFNPELLKLSDEHQNYKWVKFEDAIKSFSWQGQKNALSIINDYFTTNSNSYYMDEILLV